VGDERLAVEGTRVGPVRRLVPHQLPWQKRVVATVAYGLIRLVSFTLRFRYVYHTDLFRTEPVEPVIFAVWHNRLALSLMVYLKGPRRLQPTRRMAAIVSASRDGAVVAHILELFGAQPVRGSTSRRGPQALLELTRWAERGRDLAITPDGPRGPCYVVQEGVVGLAQASGLPIMPVSYRVSWKIRARSWDRFQIPLPFARVDIEFAPPLRVPRAADAAERERCRRRLEDTLRAMTRD
jgi:lysophospholipid acyltransferase (LPLAT)-like uncharacterized protein